ncbi:bacteriohopanetetrol glucosamine biosynthesis glycosyltransferase HpnI [Magnetospirillum molischianum]|uniref:Glycosyltransferase, probably involved in cell wall biogenesis n=1 Tax=Magnetospirillum molischianum DSM 120 TaxID=1150626 RepID=H8FNC1_MAGML|nr:bacteriohopanetetrol glucosamine biosynthesis glycosyltransferase HpnI [Magnetospirillum molischianum]CCG39859.1 Glycosyltransferase, probably involved in cell wall biogenesis [Magnetospirillum molischianum DSM 120]
MISMLFWLLTALVGAGCVYQIAAAILVRRFAAASRLVPVERPPVSLLKPLHGAEAGLDTALESTLRQDYPAFQVLFGVGDPSDSALDVVRALPAPPPGGEVMVVVRPGGPARNRKVANLLSMWPEARHDLIVVADSDVRVDRGYLDDLVAPFADPTVGVVTSLYVGRFGEGLWSRIGALGINHGFLPSALVARALGRCDGCFGASIAIRRSVLERGGGLDAVADLLADDWALGAMARAQGLRIALAARPVDIVVTEPDLRTLFDHEIRWARTIASIDRAGYFASIITQPFGLALLAAGVSLVAGSVGVGLVVLGAASACRLWAVRAEEAAFGLPRADLTDLALREILSVAVYAVASAGRTVLWRGRRFVVRRDGTLEPVEGLAS